jgi:hypothetical protein
MSAAIHHRKMAEVWPRYHGGMKTDAHPSPEFQKFDALMGKVLSVSHAEMQRREREYRKQVDANPHRRGPKRKVKPPASEAREGDILAE